MSEIQLLTLWLRIALVGLSALDSGLALAHGHASSACFWGGLSVMWFCLAVASTRQLAREGLRWQNEKADR
jgi:hypothetical protein